MHSIKVIVNNKTKSHATVFLAQVLCCAWLTFLGASATASASTVPQKFASKNANTHADLTLHFDTPGEHWENDALPLGNGKVGAAILGQPLLDKIQFNEKTLWTGGPNSSEDYQYGFPENSSDFSVTIKKVQQQLRERLNLTPSEVSEQLGHKQTGYGSFQSFGDLILSFPKTHGSYTNYKRSLDLANATARVSYSVNSINFTREYFVSYPDNSLVVHLSSTDLNAITVSARINVPDNRSYTQRTAFPQSVEVSGKLNDNQLEYAAILSAQTKRGSLHISNGQLHIKGADSVTLKLTAATNYQLSYPNYRGESAISRVNEQYKAANKYPYPQLKQRHLHDYQTLFNRVSLDIGQSQSASSKQNHRSVLDAITTDQLLNGYPSDNVTLNRALEHLYYQYGRYLLIASSRKGSLPANLQGVWNKDSQAPWSADYHLNINLQMNYWLANMTNLPETLPPLFDFVENLSVTGSQAAERLFKSSGWVVFLNSNPWGSIGLIDWPTAFWQPEAAAWMSLHFYSHYQFNQDSTFLAQRAYPIMKSASEFWLDNLVEDANSGLLVATPSYSPEHGNFSVGAAMSQQIIAELFASTKEAAQLLEDHNFEQRLAKAIARLDQGLRIGRWGQLQEWQQDVDDKTSQHRHVSHLFALHPGRQISPTETPKLAQAASTTLNARGDGGTGWSKAWKINFWARLYDGDRAHKLLSEQLMHSTLNNLWCNHPPFQIDGNFGATSGMTEMLLQSHKGTIELLPALPSAWPHGSVTGIKARGNIEVAMTWQQNALTKAVFRANRKGKIEIQNSELAREFALMRLNQPVPYERLASNKIRFSSAADQVTELLVSGN
ncbi:glycoside hydrolase family 95 protein [Alteromonas lipotrueae]|uniref:glycoside hydrolase family 95 protein n=1 Tax=Alteromonas lipotrueae TaxID=2803814 RepID=UPI001C45CB9F|nr:glycoside hydrolase family 95 protein [Alteromonas lipotrueae]